MILDRLESHIELIPKSMSLWHFQTAKLLSPEVIKVNRGHLKVSLMYTSNIVVMKLLVESVPSMEMTKIHLRFLTNGVQARALRTFFAQIVLS